MKKRLATLLLFGTAAALAEPQLFYSKFFKGSTPEFVAITLQASGQVAYQEAKDDDNPKKEKPTQVLENCLKAVNATGHIGMIGVYIAPDPGAKNEEAKNGIFSFPIADFFDKGVTMGSGQAPVKKYNEYLRDMIVNGRAKPSQIVSHHIEIDDAPEAYKKFDQRVDGYTKVLIRFNSEKAA